MRWRAAAWRGLVTVTLMAVVGLGAWVVTAPTIGDDSMVGRSTITASAVAIVALMFAIWPNRRSTPGPVEPQASRQAAEGVAHAALDRWETEAHDRRITGRGQLPVGWEWAGSDLATPAEQMNPHHDGPTHGAVTDLVNLYRNLDPNWRKLIILGGSGSG